MMSHKLALQVDGGGVAFWTVQHAAWFLPPFQMSAPPM
jgi:hypothetical protein